MRPVDLVLLAGFYVACGLGITVGFHRLFTHKSFETSAPLRALWAILGSMAMQGPLTQWVTDHRKHHALSDRPGDPHSPHAGHGDSLAEHVLGLWHSHIGWLFSTKGLERGVEYLFAALLISVGRIGDVTGRRRVFIWGLLVFLGASLITALAPSGTVLLAGRFLQGWAER